MALAVFEAALSVADAPDAAVVDVDDPLVVAETLAPLLSNSSPAVIVTGVRLVKSVPLSTTLCVPGELASSPASTCTQLAVCEATAQSTSSVLS